MPEKRCGPIRSMLERYVEENTLRFHMPGHKGLSNLPGALFDLTEVPGTDTLFDPQDGILLSQEQAASCWGAAASFLLVNGSTAGIQAMMLWVKTQRRRLLLARDCHISAIYACAAAGIQPDWINPVWNAGEQLPRWCADELPSLLPGGKSAIFLAYPDYYGRCIDLEKIKKQMLGHDSVLLADSAHGAHFVFSCKLPPDAGEYAELWVSGAHKTLPAPTQTAMLHVKHGRDSAGIARLLRGITTTSPSYLLMMGLDNSRVFMQSNRNRLDDLADDCTGLAARLSAIEGLCCWMESDVKAAGYGAYDPTRLIVDVRGLGISGWEAGAQLRRLGVQAEMCDIFRVVLITTVMDDRARLDGLYDAFAGLAAFRKAPAFNQRIGSFPARGKTAMTLRQAWLSQSAEVDFKDSPGRVAAEPFGAYPPGIPLCMPGEEITRQAVDAALEAKALGGRFFGIRNGKVLVVED